MSLNDYLIDLNDASFLSAAKEKEYGLAYTQSVSSIPLNQVCIYMEILERVNRI